MEIGIGLPNAVAGTTGAQLIEWARRADRAGFSTLASIGAISYPSYEELTVFAAAAAVTERVRLLSNVLIGPARGNAELAKQAATVDQLSGGRLTLGLGVGWRSTDYVLTGREFSKRGALFDRQLEELRQAWSGEALQPGTRPASPPPIQSPLPIVIGGRSTAAVRRTVEHAVGWTAGGMPPEAAGEFAKTVHSAWKDAGKEGSPRIYALTYFGLGDTESESRAKLQDYYQPMGPEVANRIADNVLRGPEAVRGALEAYAAAGVDELILDASVSNPAQVDLLAEVVFG